MSHYPDICADQIRNYCFSFSDQCQLPPTQEDHIMEESVNLQENIKSLDPLGADRVFSHLPTYNAEKNVQQILAATTSLIPPVEAVSHFDVAEAHAAMRDLGMLMSAIKRYGYEPCRVIPEIEPVVMLLGKKLKTVPRDTILDYSLWNPDEPRRRRYTSTVDENVLITSIQMAVHDLYIAIFTFKKLLEVELFSPQFVLYCKEINTRLESMVIAIVNSIKQVSPKIFAEELRVYWEPIEIGGHKYDGAGGAQVPLCLIDHLLWASDRSDNMYKRYYEHTIHYVDDELRKLYEANVHRPSLVTQIYAKLSRADGLTQVQKEAVLSVDRILATLIKFRQPHKKLACVTYDERYKSDPTVVGSSGHGPEILPHIIDLMRKAKGSLKEVFPF